MNIIRGLSAVILAMALGMPGTGLAHHSHASINRDDVRIYTGVVTKYGWNMPHVFLKVRGPDPEGNLVDYSIEMGSPPGMMRRGWTKNTFKVGEAITWEGAHDHNLKRHYTGLKWVERADGTRVGNDRSIKKEELIKPSTDFTGLWTRDLKGGKAHYYPPEGWNLTAFGQKMVDNFDEVQNPMRTCGNMGPPKSMLIPYPITFSQPDEKTILMQRDLMEKIRVVHLDKSVPAGAPSQLGHSIGWFEGDELVVETTNFIADKWGIHTGIDSSDQKHLLERFSLSNNGLSMDVVITVTDTVYLAETKVFEHHWNKMADRPSLQVPCTMEAAQLYRDGADVK
jgi:hypothetical protein